MDWSQDFHRYDIASSNALDLKTHCEAHYGVEDRSLQPDFLPESGGGRLGFGDRRRLESAGAATL